jgi:hypothetical protein
LIEIYYQNPTKAGFGITFWKNELLKELYFKKITKMNFAHFCTSNDNNEMCIEVFFYVGNFYYRLEL